MRRKLSLAVLVAVLALSMAAGAAYAGKPTIGKPCTQCHKGADDVVRGTLGARSEKFSTINVNAGEVIWVIKYDEGTKISGAASLAAIPAGKEIAVAFTGDVKTARASSVSVKQPYKVPAEQLVSVEQMKELAAKGPEAGGYVLIDSRPKPAYLEGHIPGAVSLSFAEFDAMAAKVLPAEKDRTIVFYCGGVT